LIVVDGDYGSFLQKAHRDLGKCVSLYYRVDVAEVQNKHIEDIGDGIRLKYSIYIAAAIQLY